MKTSIKEMITIIAGIAIGLLVTSLFGLIVGPLWALSQYFSLPHLYFWALLGGLIGALGGGIIGSESEWVAKNRFTRVMASAIFCAVIGSSAARFGGARSTNRELWLLLGGFLGICVGVLIGYWSERMVGRFISTMASALFLGGLGGFTGLGLGWNTAPDFADMAAIAGAAIGGVAGLILGAILGLIFTPQSERIPRRHRRVINGIIVGVGTGIIVSSLFSAIDDSIVASLMGYSWSSALIWGSNGGWIWGIVPGGIIGVLTVGIVELLTGRLVSQEAN